VERQEDGARGRSEGRRRNREMGVGKVGAGERKRGKDERIGAVWI